MPGDAVRKRIVSHTRRIVVKVGTMAICDPTGRPDRKTISSLARQIAGLMGGGYKMSLVTSGAIGAGMGELNLPGRPKTLPMLQAAAAVGQGQLMRIFHDAFGRRGVRVAQVLVTRDDFENRTRYLNIRNTMRALEDLGALAIINENDAVAVDEIRYGDNDIIAAQVTNMIGAELLVLLTNVEGVMKDGRLLDVITPTDRQTLKLMDSSRSALGSGGMSIKLAAADMATRYGAIAAIADARARDVLPRLLAGEKIGTVFVPTDRKTSGRRRWIGLASRPAGKIIIDEGAAAALKERGKSLLPSGITAVRRNFQKGATVAVLDQHGNEIARGLTNYSAQQIDRIKGLKTSQIAAVLGDRPYETVIHRNNLTLT